MEFGSKVTYLPAKYKAVKVQCACSFPTSARRGLVDALSLVIGLTDWWLRGPRGQMVGILVLHCAPLIERFRTRLVYMFWPSMPHGMAIEDYQNIM